MRAYRLWFVLFSAVSLATFLPLAAQEKETASDLAKTDKGYEHKPSKSIFNLPKGWDGEIRTQTSGKNTFLTLRQQKRGIEVTFSWAPLRVKMEEAVDLENKLLLMAYGADKIGKPEPAKAGDKTGFKISIDDGPTQNMKEVGVVYLFETGPNEKERWKVKIRATVPRLPKDQAPKALGDVEALLDQLVLQ